jgi:hypothetical protein
MLKLKQYIQLTEEAAEEGAKLKHITHAEDRPLFHGAAGYGHAKGALQQAHQHMATGKSDSNLTTKFDGSPSIVYGHHPETGKFFVATKSAFNKTPKLNYNAKDVDANHGHAPGLADKLKAALKHLPKIAPKQGIYQGDVMHSGVKSKSNPIGDVTMKDGKASYTPNTITYSHSGPESEAIAKSKFGIVTHTQYHGKDMHSMIAKPLTSHENFKQHPDVHQMSAHLDTSKVAYDAKKQEEFKKHMAEAEKIHKQHGGEMYKAIHGSHSGEAGHLGTYINQTVRTGEAPTAKGLQQHIMAKHEKDAAKLKTPANQEKKKAEGQAHVTHIQQNKEHYNNLLKMHGHLAAAKHTLTSALDNHYSSGEGIGHSINGTKTNPEGYVVHHTNEPTKLVNRADFARANLLKTRK